MKGKSSSGKVVQRKQGVKQLSKRDKLKADNIERKKKERNEMLNEKRGISAEKPASALDRFISKSKT